MKALVIEDERMTANRLIRKLGELRPGIVIEGPLKSIDEGVEYLSKSTPDIIFADIRLEDGLSFGIFSLVRTEAAVVFVTAYDEYAIKAFECNCIDYLLKPVTDNGISRALEKFDRYRRPLPLDDLMEAVARLKDNTPLWRRRLIMEQGGSSAVVQVKDIAYISIEYGYPTVYLKDGSSGIVNSSLEDLSRELDPDVFMRVSRQDIVALDCICRITPMPENRLMITLDVPGGRNVVVTRSNSARLKEKLY